MPTKQTIANKNWQDKNKERAKYLRKRSAARTFINKHGELADLEELRKLLDQRISELKK